MLSAPGHGGSRPGTAPGRGGPEGERGRGRAAGRRSGDTSGGRGPDAPQRGAELRPDGPGLAARTRRLPRPRPPRAARAGQALKFSSRKRPRRTEVGAGVERRIVRSFAERAEEEGWSPRPGWLSSARRPFGAPGIFSRSYSKAETFRGSWACGEAGGIARVGQGEAGPGVGACAGVGASGRPRGRGEEGTAWQRPARPPGSGTSPAPGA